MYTNIYITLFKDINTTYIIMDYMIGECMETKIRQFRQEKGITQQELAESVGVTRQTINALENARYNPSLLLAYKITKVLGKNSIEDVFVFNKND